MITYHQPEKLYEMAKNCWGLDMQMMVCVEEFSELMKEFSKYQRLRASGQDTHTSNVPELREEIVDASIMVDQMKNIFFSDPEDFEKIKEKKLKRLAQRLGVGYERKRQITRDSNSQKQAV